MKSRKDDELFFMRAPENHEGDVPPDTDKPEKGRAPNEYLEFIKDLDIIRLKPILGMFLRWSLIAIVIILLFILTLIFIVGKNIGLMGIVLITVVLCIMRNLPPGTIKALNETIQYLVGLIKNCFK